MTDKLEELERLLAAATPGPWKHIPGKRMVFVVAPECHVYSNRDDDDGEGPHHPNTIKRWNADAALIVAAINALPELVAMAKDYAKLNEPDGVLINMMRGTIPKVSANSLHKLYNAAEVSQAFPELRAVKAALEEIACHENTGLTGPGRQQADSCVNIARAALEGFNCG